MNWYKTTIRKTDRMFSVYIRTKAEWICARPECRKYFNPDISSERKKLHCSHFFSRGRESVRMDENNATALCWQCHEYWGHNAMSGGEYKEYMIEKLGQREFDMLEFRFHNVSKKRDDFMDEIVIKEMLKNLNSNKPMNDEVEKLVNTELKRKEYKLKNLKREVSRLEGEIEKLKEGIEK